MTSKEALNIIKDRNINIKINHKIGSRDIANEELNEIANTIDYCIPIIEKDLDVLEIIYNHRLDMWEIECLFDRYSNINDAMTYLNSMLNTYDQLCREEVEELKEWIKNKELEK